MKWDVSIVLPVPTTSLTIDFNSSFGTTSEKFLFDKNSTLLLISFSTSDNVYPSGNEFATEYITTSKSTVFSLPISPLNTLGTRLDGFR